MSNTPSLEPCPFCGGINIIHCGHHMYCHACGADGPDADSQHESEAIAAWNLRTPQPVAREPLTANQVSGLAESAGYWHGDMSRADFINGIRYAEAAHGIKQGGQHG